MQLGGLVEPALARGTGSVSLLGQRLSTHEGYRALQQYDQTEAARIDDASLLEHR